MPTALSEPEAPAGNGLEVLDLQTSPDFIDRPARPRDAALQVKVLSRIARSFVEAPDTLLQELVDTAVELCGAGSAGISIQRTAPDGTITYNWVATAGEYGSFLNAVLPAEPSACGMCIKRGRPQLLRVFPAFFDLMKVEAATATDGILMPWQTDNSHGTIWILAHGESHAFDSGDFQLMKILADFAALAVRQHNQQKLLVEQARHAAAAAMANELAHQINNPLQGLTNLVYLAAEHGIATDAQQFAQQMSPDLHRLCTLVQKLLTLPGRILLGLKLQLLL